LSPHGTVSVWFSHVFIYYFCIQCSVLSLIKISFTLTTPHLGPILTLQTKRGKSAVTSSFQSV
jgi:hypothetical protein